MKNLIWRSSVIVVLLVMCSFISKAQTFNAGPVTVQPGVPVCLDFNVVNAPPWPIGDGVNGPWPVSFISSVCMDILTSHPWTLEITLTSPAGTTLTLSSFNGMGGTDYDSTCFTPGASNNIAGQPAPFTGTFQPQQFPPGMQIFYGEGLNGVWQLCISDTLTDSTSLPTGPPWNGAGSTASGTMAVGGSPCSPYVTYPFIQDNTFGMCPGQSIDISSYYPVYPGWTLGFFDMWGSQISSVITQPGNYMVVMEEACWKNYPPNPYAVVAYVTVVANQYAFGPDQADTLCQGSSINLNALFNTSGATYSWTHNGMPISNTAASTVTLPGVYEIIGGDQASCDDTAQVLLTVEPTPSLGPDQNVTSCAMATYDLTQAYLTTGLTAVWKKNGVVVANPSSVSVNGVYQLVAANSAGCSDTAYLTLNISLGPALGPDQNMDYCAGTSINLTTIFNTAGFTNVWTNFGAPVSNPSNVTTPGLYTVISSNAAGCRDTANVVLNLISSPALGPNQTVNFCTNETVDLNSLFNVTGLTTTWTLNGIPVANPGSVWGSGNYLLNATNSTGCSSQANAVLTSVASPALGPDQNISFCPGGGADLTMLFSTSGLTTSWTLNGAAVANPSSINVAGVYQLIATNSTGCPDTAFANVIAASSPIIGPDQQATTCQGIPVNLNLLFNSGGNSVNWTNNNNPVSNPNSITSAGVYVITLTNASGCSVSANATVTVNPKPELGGDEDVTICPGAFADISTIFPTAGMVANWSINGTTVVDPTTIGAAGNYQLIVMDVNGCSDTAFANVTISSGPDLGPDQQYDLCDWMNIDLNTVFNFNGLNAEWTYNGTSIQNTNTIHDAGNYSVVVTDQQGCSDEAVVLIENVYCECEADFAFSAKCIQEPVQFVLLADSAIVGAVWSFGFPGMQSSTAINPSVKFLTTEIVQVTLIANLSCGTKEITKNVFVEDCSKTCPLYFPSAFTPNKDGKNERFGPYVDCIPQNYEMEIRNRFGQVVFTSDAPGSHWDGSYQNQPSPSGIYVYSVNYKVPYQSKKQITGTVSLVR